MPSILNCFKRLIPGSRRNVGREQDKATGRKPITKKQRQAVKPIQVETPAQAPATPIHDEAEKTDEADADADADANVDANADARAKAEAVAETVKGAGGAGGAELDIEGNTAGPIEELLTEEPVAADAPVVQHQPVINDRPIAVEQSSTNGVPRIAVERQATLTTQNLDAIPRSRSNGSLTARQLSRDNSQTSQTSLRSRAESKGSSIAEHWLKEQLENAGLECPKHHHCFLIPKSAQEELITVTNVARDLQARDPHIDELEAVEIANVVCNCASRLYAILAYIKKGAAVKGLLAEGITDEDLPFVRKANTKSKFALSRKNGGYIKTLDAWSDKHLKKFDQHQWWMSAPVFKLNDDLYELDEKTILPFVHFEPPKGAEGKKQAGYSEVYPVRIHPAHHEFWESSGLVYEEPLVAVKQLYSDDEEEFEKERTILTAVGMKNHPHLIKLLATYKYDGKYHLMFPLANANLRQYWEDRPYPVFSRDTVLWSLEQMTGIANGLLRVHTYKVTRPLSISGAGNIRIQNDGNLSVKKGEEWYGRHGDIKPENVLWFEHNPETDDPKGILQIADFGLGRFHGRDSRSRVNPDTVVSSPTYEPPECKLRLPVSRAYDMWSLGCLHLEFITWLLKGSAEIDGFSSFRGRQATATGIDDDNFFTIINDGYVQRAIVREQVVTWTTRLHEHEKCSQLIHDLLDLTMKELLVIDSSSRCPAGWLFHKLNEYLERAQHDEEYLLKPVPRTRKPEPERTQSTPGSLNTPKSNQNQNQKRNSVITFADEKSPVTSIKEEVQTKLPRDLVLRNSGTPSRTWPIHRPQAMMPQFSR